MRLFATIRICNILLFFNSFSLKPKESQLKCQSRPLKSTVLENSTTERSISTVIIGKLQALN